jgi:HEAT repeat protein
VQAVLAVAQSGEPRLRQVALLAIGELAELGSEEGIQVASEATHSELPALRYQALVALRNLQQLGAINKIVESARDEDPEVRWVVVRLLEEFWTFDIVSGVDDITRAEVERKVCSALGPLLNDGESRVRVAVILLLARLRGAEAAEAIAGMLSSDGVKLTKNDEEVAIELAGNLRIRSAIVGLKRRAWPLFWETPLSWKARVALAQMGDERAREAVLESLHSKQAHKCARAIEAAGQIGLEQARPRLLALLQNPTEYDAEAIQTALKRLGPPA